VPSAAAASGPLAGELLHRAMFQPKEWDRERPVILEEIKRRNDDPESALWDLLHEALFREERLRRPVHRLAGNRGGDEPGELWRTIGNFTERVARWWSWWGILNPGSDEVDSIGLWRYA